MSWLTGNPNNVGAGKLYPAGSVADSALAQKLVTYRKVVAGRYQSLKPDELNELPAGPLQVTPKVDGELWFAVKQAGSVALVAHNGRALTGDLPVLKELVATFGGKAGEGEILAGELFALSKAGRPRVGDVASALGGQGDGGNLGFMAFDVVCGAEGANPPDAWTERLARITELLAGGKRVQPIRCEAGNGATEVQAKFTEWVDGGKAEGLVVRAGDGRIFKVKPSVTLDCVVVGFTQRTEDAAQVRSVLLAMLREDGSWQLVGSTGNLGSDDDRRALMQTLQPTVVASNYRAVASSGEMYRFVQPKVVAEVTCTDLQPEDSDGAAIRQWALAFGSDGWTRVCPVAGAALLHPVWTRRRDDKQPTRLDVRIEQLAERVAVGELGRKAAVEQLPASEIVRREVYTKETKGQLAVRKLVVWQTHKETVAPEFPAFVVHWTDYSAGRKTPLEREVRPAPNREEADRIAEAMLASEIGKGWGRI